MGDFFQSVFKAVTDLVCGGCCLSILLLIAAVYFVHLRMPDELRQIIRGK